nr:hypothetical protein [Tanacetum cinerariifolium]
RANLAVLQGGNQCLLVHDFAPGDVDKDRLGAHPVKLRGADKPLGFASQRHRQANEIRFGQQRVEAAIGCVEACLHRRLGRVAVIDHRHPETEMPPLRHRLADPSHADDAQRLAMHVRTEMLRAQIVRPLAVADHGRQFHHPAGSGHDQREAGVGSGFGEHIRRVGPAALRPASGLRQAGRRHGAGRRVDAPGRHWISGLRSASPRPAIAGVASVAPRVFCRAQHAQSWECPVQE